MSHVLHHVKRNGKLRLGYSLAFLVILAAFVGAVLAGCGGGGKSSGGSNAPAGSGSGTSTGKSGGGGSNWG